MKRVRKLLRGSLPRSSSSSRSSTKRTSSLARRFQSLTDNEDQGEASITSSQRLHSTSIDEDLPITSFEQFYLWGPGAEHREEQQRAASQEDDPLPPAPASSVGGGSQRTAASASAGPDVSALSAGDHITALGADVTEYSADPDASMAQSTLEPPSPQHAAALSTQQQANGASKAARTSTGTSDPNGKPRDGEKGAAETLKGPQTSDIEQGGGKTSSDDDDGPPRPMVVVAKIKDYFQAKVSSFAPSANPPTPKEVRVLRREKPPLMASPDRQKKKKKPSSPLQFTLSPVIQRTLEQGSVQLSRTTKKIADKTKETLSQIGKSPIQKSPPKQKDGSSTLAPTNEAIHIVVKGEDSDGMVTAFHGLTIEGFSVIAGIGAIVSMITIQSRLVDIMALLTLCLSVLCFWQKATGLERLPRLRQQQKELKRQIQADKEENDKVETALTNLQKQRDRMQYMEDDLREIATQMGGSIHRLMFVVHENEQVQLEIKQIMDDEVLQHLCKAVLATQTSNTDMFNTNYFAKLTAPQVQDLQKELHTIPGVEFDERRFQAYLEADGSLTLRNIINVAQYLRDASVPPDQQIFHYNQPSEFAKVQRQKWLVRKRIWERRRKQRRLHQKRNSGGSGSTRSGRSVQSLVRQAVVTPTQSIRKRLVSSSSREMADSPKRDASATKTTNDEQEAPPSVAAAPGLEKKRSFDHTTASLEEEFGAIAAMIVGDEVFLDELFEERYQKRRQEKEAERRRMSSPAVLAKNESGSGNDKDDDGSESQTTPAAAATSDGDIDSQAVTEKHGIATRRDGGGGGGDAASSSLLGPMRKDTDTDLDESDFFVVDGASHDGNGHVDTLLVDTLPNNKETAGGFEEVVFAQPFPTVESDRINGGEATAPLLRMDSTDTPEAAELLLLAKEQGVGGSTHDAQLLAASFPRTDSGSELQTTPRRRRRRSTDSERRAVSSTNSSSTTGEVAAAAPPPNVAPKALLLLSSSDGSVDETRNSNKGGSSKG